MIDAGFVNHLSATMTLRFRRHFDGCRLYVQVRYSFDSEAVMRSELGNLETIGDSFPKYAVLMDAGIHAGVTSTSMCAAV